MSSFLKKLGGLDSRIYLGCAFLLLAASLFAPLWSTGLESPQYHGQDELHVTVFAGGLKGNLQEIKTLNQYIGVSFPEKIPELGYSVWVLGGLSIFALMALALPEGGRKKAAGVIAIFMLLAAFVAAVCLQYRLYCMGHDRGKAIIDGFHDFTPLIFGVEKVANFTITTLPEWGAWFYFLALLLMGWVGWRPIKDSFLHQRIVETSNGETPGVIKKYG